MLLYLERLAKAGTAHFQFVVTNLVAHLLLKEAAQGSTVFNPYSIGMVNLDDNTIVITHLNVYKEVARLTLQPLFH